MPIVRLREANCNQDKELPDIESKKTQVSTFKISPFGEHRTFKTQIFD